MRSRIVKTRINKINNNLLSIFKALGMCELKIQTTLDNFYYHIYFIAGMPYLISRNYILPTVRFITPKNMISKQTSCNTQMHE